jgi:type I restriction enzyme S subunit
MITHPFRSILGPIPDDWEIVPLKHVLTESSAGDWGDDRGGIQLRVVRSTNFTNDRVLDLSNVAIRGFPAEQAGRFDMRSGDLLIERSGGGPTQPVGRVVRVERDLSGFGFSNFVQLLRVDDDAMSPDFVGWCLYQLHRSGIVERLQHQTTQMRNLDFRDYMCIRLPRPPREEQDLMAAMIAGAHLARQAAVVKLEAAHQVRSSLVNTLFAWGLPGRHTEFDTTKWLRYPKCWNRRPLRKLASIEAGFTKGRDLGGSSTLAVPYVTVVNVQDGYLDLTSVSQTLLKLNEVPDGLLRVGDILMTEGGDRDKLGRGAIWCGQIDRCAYQNHIFRVRLDNDVYRAKLFHYLIQAVDSKAYFYAHAKQTSNLCTINSRELGRFEVAVPEIDEQDEMIHQLEAADRVVDTAMRQRDAAERLKGSLLQNLLTGQVRVSEAAAV